MNPIPEAKFNEATEKLYAQEQQAQCGGQAVRGIGVDTAQPWQTQREEAEKNARFHFERAGKAARAAAFFGEHPEFDEFIQLIRAGVIGI
jgi:hypothetical protein